MTGRIYIQPQARRILPPRSQRRREDALCSKLPGALGGEFLIPALFRGVTLTAGPGAASDYGPA